MQCPWISMQEMLLAIRGNPCLLWRLNNWYAARRSSDNILCANYKILGQILANCDDITAKSAVPMRFERYTVCKVIGGNVTKTGVLIFVHIYVMLDFYSILFPDTFRCDMRVKEDGNGSWQMDTSAGIKFPSLRECLDVTSNTGGNKGFMDSSMHIT